MVYQSQELRRRSDATNVAKWGMLRKIIRVNKREENIKILSHQMFMGV